MLLGYCPVNGGLNFLHRSFAAGIYEWGNIKTFSRMVKHILGNGQGGFAEHITENIIQFEIRDCKAVLSTVLFAGFHIGQLAVVS